MKDSVAVNIGNVGEDNLCKVYTCNSDERGLYWRIGESGGRCYVKNNNDGSEPAEAPRDGVISKPSGFLRSGDQASYSFYIINEREFRFDALTSKSAYDSDFQGLQVDYPIPFSISIKAEDGGYKRLLHKFLAGKTNGVFELNEAWYKRNLFVIAATTIQKIVGNSSSNITFESLQTNARDLSIQVRKAINGPDGGLYEMGLECTQFDFEIKPDMRESFIKKRTKEDAAILKEVKP